VHDVNYFLASALDVSKRRVHERDLLGHYPKALATFGVSAPRLDEAWSVWWRSCFAVEMQRRLTGHAELL
jgi:hypothetical protein